MNPITVTNERRSKICFWLCMLCTFCSDVHLIVGMGVYEKIFYITSPIQTAAALAFLFFALPRPRNAAAKRYLCFGIMLACWTVISKHYHSLFGEPREYVGVLLERFLVMLPYAALMGDEKECRGLKGAGALTLAVCVYLCVWSVRLFFGWVPEAMQEVHWSGARMNVQWNPIIFAVILFMGIILCVAACFLVKKKWQRGALLAFALLQFLFISMTHSRTVMLMLCAFVVGVFFLVLGQGSASRHIAWTAAGLVLAAGLFWISETVYNANNQRLIARMEASGEEFMLNDQGHITDGVTNQHSFKEDAGSLNGRTETWQIVIDKVMNSRELRLFGTSRFRDSIRKDMAHAHNSWLQMLADLGIPGLVLSLLLTGEILAALARVFLFCRDKGKLVMALWVLCMLPIGVMEPFLFSTRHVGDLFILTSGYLWAWGTRTKA